MNRLYRLLSDNWAVLPPHYESLLGLISSGMLKGNIEAVHALLAKTDCHIVTVDPCTMCEHDLTSDVPKDAVAVVELKGILYSWITDRLISFLAAAECNPNILGVVLVIDGPGGMVSRVDEASDIIRNYPKPIATLVDGVMASAHFWLGVSSNRKFIASSLCEVGSVGVVITHCSYKNYYERVGIDYREIYPDTADLKNRELRALVDNDDEGPLKARAERIHKAFAASVAASLGVEYNPELPLFRGEMFYADDAVKTGYIDQFGRINDAVRWVFAKAISRKASQLY